MDNFSVHHTESVISLLHESGIAVTFLPPYSPDMNPTEEAFSYIKSYLKLHEDIMEATGNTIQLIKSAIDNITVNMCNKWITDSGYNY